MLDISLSWHSEPIRWSRYLLQQIVPLTMSVTYVIVVWNKNRINKFVHEFWPEQPFFWSYLMWKRTSIHIIIKPLYLMFPPSSRTGLNSSLLQFLDHCNCFRIILYGNIYMHHLVFAFSNFLCTPWVRQINPGHLDHFAKSQLLETWKNSNLCISIHLHIQKLFYNIRTRKIKHTKTNDIMNH